jgi:hypothetical protein
MVANIGIVCATLLDMLDLANLTQTSLGAKHACKQGS